MQFVQGAGCLTHSTLRSAEIIKDWLVKPLRDQHVKPKSKATFRCELFKDTPNWKWLKGENELKPSDKVEITKDGQNVTLTINNCQPDDVSDYTFEVEDRRYTAKLTLGGLGHQEDCVRIVWTNVRCLLLTSSVCCFRA